MALKILLTIILCEIPIAIISGRIASENSCGVRNIRKYDISHITHLVVVNSILGISFSILLGLIWGWLQMNEQDEEWFYELLEEGYSEEEALQIILEASEGWW